MIKNISVGSDPEFAAFENEEPKSAVGFIPGTKREPFPLTEDGEFSIQIDNVGVEGCIPPAYTKEEFVKNIETIKYLTQQKLQETQPLWHLRCVSSARYSKQQLNSKTAQLFGCEASYDAYTLGISPRPTPEEVGNLRSFGFHIHIGYECDGDVYDAAIQIIKSMDLTVGLGSLFLDTDTDRRKIYGNPGDFRFRQIENINIVEYRTLGGAMSRNEVITGWVYDGVMQAVNLANNWNSVIEVDALIAAEAIRNNNIEVANNLMNKYNISNPYEHLNNYTAKPLVDTVRV